jgi:predicted nucleic acid-binding Zn ribbon protein
MQPLARNKFMPSTPKDITRNKRVASLSTVLDKLMKIYQIDDKIKENEALLKWPEIVGPSVSAVTSPIRVKDGTLYIKVKNDVWRNELYYQKLQILQKIERTLKKRIISEIVLL